MESDSSCDDFEEDHKDDHELLHFQKQKSIPMVRVSSVQVDKEDETHIIDIDDFSKVDDLKHGQMGLLPAGKEGQFAKAVLKTHQSSDRLMV